MVKFCQSLPHASLHLLLMAFTISSNQGWTQPTRKTNLSCISFEGKLALLHLIKSFLDSLHCWGNSRWWHGLIKNPRNMTEPHTSWSLSISDIAGVLAEDQSWTRHSEHWQQTNLTSGRTECCCIAMCYAEAVTEILSCLTRSDSTTQQSLGCYKQGLASHILSVAGRNWPQLPFKTFRKDIITSLRNPSNALHPDASSRAPQYQNHIEPLYIGYLSLLSIIDNNGVKIFAQLLRVRRYAFLEYTQSESYCILLP